MFVTWNECDGSVATVDLTTGENRTIVTLDSVRQCLDDPDAMRYALMFTHAKWAPDGSHALLVLTNSLQHKADRNLPFYKLLLLCKPDGSDLRVFSGGPGHPTWDPNGPAIYGYERISEDRGPTGRYGIRRDLDCGIPNGIHAMVRRPLDGSVPEVIHAGPGCHGHLDPSGKRVVTDQQDYPSPGDFSVLLYERGGGASPPLLPRCPFQTPRTYPAFTPTRHGHRTVSASISMAWMEEFDACTRSNSSAVSYMDTT